jgi:hypothetical protein
VADRNQILQPSFIRFLNERDDIAFFALPENDFTVRLAGTPLAQQFPRLPTFFSGRDF